MQTAGWDPSPHGRSCPGRGASPKGQEARAKAGSGAAGKPTRDQQLPDRGSGRCYLPVMVAAHAGPGSPPGSLLRRSRQRVPGAEQQGDAQKRPRAAPPGRERGEGRGPGRGAGADVRAGEAREGGRGAGHLPDSPHSFPFKGSGGSPERPSAAPERPRPAESLSPRSPSCPWETAAKGEASDCPRTSSRHGVHPGLNQTLSRASPAEEGRLLTLWGTHPVHRAERASPAPSARRAP